VVAISRNEIYKLKDRLIFKPRKKSTDLVGYFLHLFEDGQPLQDEAVYDWQELPPDGVPVKHIQQCLEEALAEKFIEEKNGEFYRTEAGKEKADEVLPMGPSMG
jgi:hypothetical protein